MDDRRFDAFVRTFASGQSRRALLKGLLGMGGVAVTGAALRAPEAEAARRPTPTPTPRRCPGRQTWNGQACVCPPGSTTCGPDCCPIGQAECCDNACCYGACYGEELCCPTGQVTCDGACCAPGEECFEGTCRRCTICGDDCCAGATPQCCRNDETTVCAPAGATCCSADSDCRALNRCDGLTAHTATCVQGVCVESVVNCQGSDHCYDYTCDQGVCGATRDPGCCEVDGQCTAVDACTPAKCLNSDTCNAVSTCGSGEQCCNGICALTEDRCCTTDDDCAGLDFCGESDAYHYTCQGFVCTRVAEDCLGDDPCVDYFCADGACGSNRRPNCCSTNAECQPVDGCTPALCFEQTATCNTVSICGGAEQCCADGGCSQNGACNRGCTIEGVSFPPCVDGCPTCVAPDGGTLCGCARVTGTACASTEACKATYVAAVCAGPPGSGICVIPSQPV